MKPIFTCSPRLSLLAALLTSVAPVVAFANPVDGVVSAGAATISSAGNTLTVNQSSDKAVIDWRTFDIGIGETTQFLQPGSSSLTVNRVGSGGSSQIYGTLTANGNIVIINPNGVMFHSGSQVDVNSLVVSTADMSNADAMAGRLHFTMPGNPNATIENRGMITAKDAGLVGLVAPNVINSGIITAKLGRIHLASGDSATVDLYGDGLIEVKASDALTSQLVKNTGTLNADGGTIAMTAAAGRQTVDSLIQVSGALNARSIGTKNGRIYIYAEGSNAVAGNVAANKGQKTGVSTVLVDGTLDVSGKNPGETGGRVEILGDHIAIMDGAVIDASGAAGGGTIHIGGQYLGLGDTPAALVTIIQATATMNASALIEGNGGEVIVYADNRTEFFGTIEANGAGDQGNGGFVETSGRIGLLAFGEVRIIAGRNGKAGAWLMDPASITVTAATNTNIGGDPNFTATAAGGQVSAASIVANLDAGTNVTIVTSNDGFAGNGDIFVTSAITTTGSGSLTLSAYRNVSITAAVTLNGGALTMRADNAGNSSGLVYVDAAISTNGGNITVGGGSGAITAGSGYAVGNSVISYGFYNTANGTIAAAGGNIIINGKSYSTTTNSLYGVLISGAISTTGSGTISINGIGQGTSNSGNDFGVFINAGVTTVNGNITVTGTGGGAGTGGSNYGVAYSGTGGYTRASGIGGVSVTGTGGGGASSTGGNIGVVANYLNAIQTNSGNITVVGNGGGTAGASSIGVLVGLTVASSISSTSGSISITGTGASSSGDTQHGVAIGGFAGSSVTTGGSGTITLSGTAGGITNSATNKGVYLNNGAEVSTVNGSLTITGSGGGAGTGTSNSGVEVSGASSTIKTTGSGALSITGTGGNSGGSGGTNHGIYSAIANGIQTTGTGNMTLTGTKGGQSTSYGVVTDVANGITTAGTSGTITVLTDTISLNLANNINAVGSLTLAPKTTGTMAIGTTGSTLNLSDTQLGYINGASYIFGSTSAGNLTINTAKDFATKNVSFISSGNISLAGTLTKATGAGTATYLFQANGNISNSSSAGIVATTGAIDLTLNADYDQGTSPGGTIALTGGSFTSNGGNIIMGGGTSPSTQSAYSAAAIALAITGSATVDANGGNIILNGSGYTRGVRIANSTVKTTGNGSITINGTATSAGGAQAYGADIDSATGTLLLETQHGDIAITGTGSGASTTNLGIAMQANGGGTVTVRTLGTGDLLMTGSATGGTTTIDLYLPTGSYSSASDDVTLTGNTINFGASSTITAGDTLSLLNRTAIAMNIGGAYISNGSLSRMTAANYIFGSTTATGVTVGTTNNFGDGNLTFISGGDITLSTTLAKSSGTGTATYLLRANGNVVNSGSAGVNVTSGAANLTMTSDNDVSGAGSITLTSAALSVNGGTITLNSNGQSVTQSGSIGGDETINSSNGAVSIGTLNGDTASTRSLTVNAGTATFTTTSTIGATNKLNNLTVVSDDVALGGNISGAGTLTLQPHSAASEVRLNDATAGGTYSLSSTELGYFVDGWSGISIGKSTGTGSMYMGATSWTDPVTFLNNYRVGMNGGFTGTGNASLTFTVGASGWLSSSAITTAGGNVTFAGGGSMVGTYNITTAGGDISVTYAQINNGYSSPTWSTSGGNVTISNTLTRNSSGGSTSGKTFTINAGAGTISFGGTVNGDYGLTASGATISMASDLGGSEALGAISLTSTNGITLPSITASSIFVQTTGGTSDITIANGKSLTASGSGTALTLASARNFINSSGSATPFSTVSGRWLVYSTNPSADTLGSMTSGFVRYGCTYGGSCPTGVTIPGTGNGFIYTYQPTLTITPSAQTITYGNGATTSGYGYGVTGYLTSAAGTDSSADTLAGTLTGTTAYSAGDDVGTYGLSYSSGTLTSALGYQFSYANNATALTVGQRTLTVGLTGTVSKTYDGNTAATLASGNYSLTNVYGTDALTISNTSGTYADKNVGTSKNVTVTGLTLAGAKAANYTLSSASVTDAVGTVTAKALTLSGLGASNKTYDGNTTATLTGTASFSGLVGGDTVTLGGTGAGAFGDKNVGTGKAVTVTGYTIAGADSGNYSFSQPTGITADITAKALTITGITASNKIYDATTTATLAGTAAFSGLVGGDTVTLGGTGAGAFGDKNVGTGKAVTVTGYTIAGADSGNYSFSQPTGITADITAKTLTLAGVTASNKTYDGNTAATLGGAASLSGVVGADTVTLGGAGTGAFNNKNVGTGKTVTITGYTIGGADSGNYTLDASVTADITAKALTITGLTADNKIYDGATTATLSGTASFSGLIGGDTVTLNAGTGTFADKNVGVGKAVTVSGYTISGADSGNYSFSQHAGLTADITQKTLTATADTITITNGTAVPAGTVTYTGFAGSDGVGDIDTLATVTSVQSGTPAIGTYAANYTASGAGDNNYTFSYVAGDLIVSAASTPTSTSTATNDTVPVTVQKNSQMSAGGLFNDMLPYRLFSRISLKYKDFVFSYKKWNSTGSKRTLSIPREIEISPALQEQLGLESEEV